MKTDALNQLESPGINVRNGNICLLADERNLAKKSAAIRVNGR